MSEVMIDLETLGTENDSVVLSIGAVEFECYPKEFKILSVFSRALNTEEQEQVDRKVYSSTFMWWMRQTKEAQENLLKLHVTSVKDALESLRTFCNGVRINGIWGNGSMFDNVLIVSLAKSFSVKPPWSYKKDRCYRTLKNLYPNAIEPVRSGVHHDALDDATWQAEHLDQIFRCMGAQQ